MAKSFKEYFGDFNAMRDQLLFAIGEMAQVPQRATNLIPRLESFANSDDPKLRAVGAELLSRTKNVRDISRADYDKAQALSMEMLAVKDAIEKNPGFQSMMAQSTTNLVFSIATSFLSKDADSKFFKESLSRIIDLAGRSTTTIISLKRATAEIRDIEQAAQKAADYAVGKGILPEIVSAPSGLPKAGIALAGVLAVAGVGYLLMRGRK